MSGALAFSLSAASAIDILEDFDGAELDAAVWEVDRNKTGSLIGGHLEIEDDGPNWGRYAIKSEQRLFVPEAGETTVFEWTLAPSSITTDAGQSIRFQIGIVSNNETSPNPEHWPNTSGGLWIDLDNIQNTDTANTSGTVVYANDTKQANSTGTQSAVFVPWNWQTENKTLRLELTNESYKWLDGGTVLWEDTLANAGINNEFGNGSFSTIAPEITEPTSIEYMITVTKEGEEDATRIVSVNVIASPELSLDGISDDFSSNSIDAETWAVTGAIPNTIDTGVVTWNTAGGQNWAHGELDTQKAFPIPPAGATSTITWNIGPATVSANSVNDELRGNRLVMGVVSALEHETFTLQHFQNTAGGLWMDIANMSNADTTSVSGEFHQADDTKPKDQNAPSLAGFTITDWNWETEDREFSIILTNTGYTWLDGTTELATATYAESGIDTGPGGEFSKGFRIMFAAVKYEDGSGTMKLNSINFENGGVAPPAPLPEISSIVDNGDGTVTLTWNSIPDTEYAIETNPTLQNADWEEFIDGVVAEGTTKSFTLNTDGEKLFYRVKEL